MGVEAVVFDLDETLLDTRVLAAARDVGDWTRVKAQLNQVTSYEIDGEEVHRLPAKLRREGVKVGLLTHAPSWYAAELCDRFKIRVDAIVTGSDGYPPKPDPTSLRSICEELGVSTDDAVYVGDLDTDTAASAAAGVLSIGVCWSRRAPEAWRRWWPDIAFAKPQHLLELDVLDARRPLAEALLKGNDPLWHWGTIMRVESGVSALGRYFTPEDVDRHPGHALSRLVLNAKNDEAAAAKVAEIFAALAERPSWRAQHPELVVSVPPKPSEDYDRFAVVRESIAAALGVRESDAILKMEFEVPNYKSLPHDARRLANEDRFTASDLDGERVLLIDDVLTSGGQVEVCRDVLLDAGASRVDVIALAATQNRLPEACPVCGAHLRVYVRGYDGRPFIGCPAYFTTGCRYTRNLP